MIYLEYSYKEIEEKENQAYKKGVEQGIAIGKECGSKGTATFVVITIIGLVVIAYAYYLLNDYITIKFVRWIIEVIVGWLALAWIAGGNDMWIDRELEKRGYPNGNCKENP